MGEMVETTLEMCQSCYYGLGPYHHGGVTCGYLMMTDNRRGCPVGLCDKYREMTQEEKANRHRRFLQEGYFDK